MTPTLYGRWQTRFLLLATIGFIVTLLFGYVYNDYSSTIAFLLYVICLGFVWDILYTYLQTLRWDHDWPPAYQFFAGVWEGVVIWGLQYSLTTWQLWGYTTLPGVDAMVTYDQFWAHYATVWVTTFLASQGLLRIIFPRWRFHGGEWL